MFVRLREPMICPKVSSKGCQVEIRSRDRRLRTPHVRFRTTPEFQELCRALLVEAMVARRHFGFLYLEPISINWRTVVTGSPGVRIPLPPITSVRVIYKNKIAVSQD